jgi:acetolactate synthase-1/2/3 large subunit
VIRKPEDIRFELEKAWHLCRSGRPGPVWLDVPLDIQAAQVDETALAGYTPEQETFLPETSEVQLNEIIARLKRAERPAIIAGIGVRHGKGTEHLLDFAEQHDIPVLTSISGIDLIESEHPLFFGRPGILGERSANFIMQNSDFLLVLGTRMGLRIIGYAYEKIARAAFKVMVDADAGELQKPTFKPDIPVHADAGEFLKKLLPQIPADYRSSSAWLQYCRRLKEQYPVVTDEHRSRTDYVSTYAFAELVGKKCADDAVIVTGNGVAYTSTFQAIPVRKVFEPLYHRNNSSESYPYPYGLSKTWYDKRTIPIEPE